MLPNRSISFAIDTDNLEKVSLKKKEKRVDFEVFSNFE